MHLRGCRSSSRQLQCSRQGSRPADQVKGKLIAAGMTREAHESWAEAMARFFGITMSELKTQLQMRAQGAG